MLCEMGKGISNSEIQGSRGKLQGKSQADWAEIPTLCPRSGKVNTPQHTGCLHGMPSCSQCLESWAGTWHRVRPLCLSAHLPDRASARRRLVEFKQRCQGLICAGKGLRPWPGNIRCTAGELVPVLGGFPSTNLLIVF